MRNALKEWAWVVWPLGGLAACVFWIAEEGARGFWMVCGILFITYILNTLRQLKAEVARLREAAGLKEMTDEEVDASDAA